MKPIPGTIKEYCHCIAIGKPVKKDVHTMVFKHTQMFKNYLEERERKQAEEMDNFIFKLTNDLLEP